MGISTLGRCASDSWLAFKWVPDGQPERLISNFKSDTSHVREEFPEADRAARGRIGDTWRALRDSRPLPSRGRAGPQIGSETGKDPAVLTVSVSSWPLVSSSVS